jgi:hypothetical protein
MDRLHFVKTVGSIALRSFVQTLLIEMLLASPTLLTEITVAQIREKLIRL